MDGQPCIDRPPGACELAIARGCFIQTDAAIHLGTSDGPLVNLKGELISIPTAIFSQTGSYMGIGFATPRNMARRVMSRLRRDRVLLLATRGNTTIFLVHQPGVIESTADTPPHLGLECVHARRPSLSMGV